MNKLARSAPDGYTVGMGHIGTHVIVEAIQPVQFDVLKASGMKISPFMQKLLDLIPSTGNNTVIGDGLNTTGYSFNARGNETRDNITLKGDYNMSQKSSFALSYVWNRDIVDRPDYTPFYTVAPPIFNDNSNRLISATWRWTPSATLTNELRGGVNEASDQPGTGYSVDFDVAARNPLHDTPPTDQPFEAGSRTYPRVLTQHR